MVENETIYVWSWCLVKFIFQCLPFLCAAEFVIYIVYCVIVSVHFFGISHLILVLVSHVSLLSGDLSPPVFLSLMAGSILSLCEHSSIFLVFLMIYSPQSLWLFVYDNPCFCPFFVPVPTSASSCFLITFVPPCLPHASFFKPAHEFAQRVRHEN